MITEQSGKAYILIGVSGSGKSTLAEKMMNDEPSVEWIHVERDMIRKELFPFARWSEYHFTRTKENKVSEEFKLQITQTPKYWNKNIIVSDTNLDKNHRQNLTQWLTGLGFEVIEVPVMVDYETAVKRDLQRQYSVGKDVINKQWVKWIEYLREKGMIYQYKNNYTLPNAIIFDIDGTVAEMGDRSPFEWNKVQLDTLRDHIHVLIKLYEMQGFTIIFLSGRDGSCFDLTLDWLDQNLDLDNFNLIMRKEGDPRKDSIIKEELFKEHIAPYYNVCAVYDDRPQVVRMWHDIGIPNVFAVADQRNEF